MNSQIHYSLKIILKLQKKKNLFKTIKIENVKIVMK